MSSAVAKPRLHHPDRRQQVGDQQGVDDEAGAVLRADDVLAEHVAGEARRRCRPCLGEVISEATSSTSGRTGTGLKKWMPITCSGRRVAVASFMIGIDDVFEASTASALVTTSSSRRKASTLSVLVLADRLDHQVAVGEGRPVVGEVQPGEGGVVVGLAELAAARAPPQRLLDPGPAGLDQRRRGLDDDHVAAVAGAHLGDAGAHQAAAEHPDPFDLGPLHPPQYFDVQPNESWTSKY